MQSRFDETPCGWRDDGLPRESTTDPVEMDTYASMASAAAEGHNLIPRVLYGSFELLEGAPFEGAVVLEFPTAGQARAWYDSPSYQAAAAHRRAGANYRVFIIDGVS